MKKKYKRFHFAVDNEDFEGLQIEEILKNTPNKSQFIRNAILYYSENFIKPQQEKQNLEESVRKVVKEEMSSMLEQIQKSLSNIQVVAGTPSGVAAGMNSENKGEELTEDNAIIAGDSAVSFEDIDDFLGGLDVFDAQQNSNEMSSLPEIEEKDY